MDIPRVRCASCHRSYAIDRFRQLGLSGFNDLPDGSFLEFRTCTCRKSAYLFHEKLTLEERALLEFLHADTSLPRSIAVKSNKGGGGNIPSKSR